MIHLGIDPGKINTGIAVISSDGLSFSTNCIDASSLSMLETINNIFGLANGLAIETVSVERFIAYEGINSKASEFIVMIIGAIVLRAEQLGIPVYQFRAIDWKMNLCKSLYKTKGFKNPSKSHKLDKEFSLAAAKCITGYDFKTDHEADAVCLAYYGSLEHEVQKRKEERNKAEIMQTAGKGVGNS